MDTISLRNLIVRISDRIATGSTDESEAPSSEDAADFLSAERFERERRQFFLDTPQIVGFAGEVAAPGQFVARESMGIPILVTRDRAGRLHAFVNACAHRGARVAEGEGTARGGRFLCRFHGWSFDLEGRLAARPRGTDFEPGDARCGLKRLPVSDRSGLIVVGLRPEMAQSAVDAHLLEIEPALAGLELGKAMSLDSRRYVVDANWKLVSMLSYESEHFASLHRDTVATMFASNAIVDFFGRHSRWCFALKGSEKLRDQDPASWPERFPGAVNHQLFPGTVVITTWEIAQLIRSEPGPTPGTTVVHYHGVYFDEAKREALKANYALGLEAFEKEDLPAALECQQGLVHRGGAFFVSRFEPVVAFWRRQWRQALRD